MATDALGLPVVTSKAYVAVGLSTPVIGTDRVLLLFGDRNDSKLVVKASSIFNKDDLVFAILAAGNLVWAPLAHAHPNADMPLLKWKNVLCRTTANVNLASGGIAAGTALDGITVATGDLVLVAAQSTAAENGVYVVPASGAASRASDFDTSDEIRSAVILVERGTVHKRTIWLNTNDSTITVGSTAVTFTDLKTALGLVGATRVLDTVAGNPASTVGASVSTEQTAYTFTVPGGTLSIDGALHLRLALDVLNNSGGNSNFSLRVKYGTTVLWGDLIVLATSATRHLLHVDVILFSSGNAGNQRAEGFVMLSDGAAGSIAGTGSLSSTVRNQIPIAGPATEDSTADKAFAVTIQFSTTSASQGVRVFNAKLVSMPVA